jgi:cyclase
MATWSFTKGLHDLGNGCYAWLQPDGSWGYSNAGLIVDRNETLLVDTLFDLKLTREMLDGMRKSVPQAEKIGTVFNTHGNGDHTFGNHSLRERASSRRTERLQTWSIGHLSNSIR